MINVFTGEIEVEKHMQFRLLCIPCFASKRLPSSASGYDDQPAIFL
jgi:hypothetical protein